MFMNFFDVSVYSSSLGIKFRFVVISEVSGLDGELSL